MEEKHKIIMLKFSAKQELPTRVKQNRPHLAAKITVNEVKMTLFNG